MNTKIDHPMIFVPCEISLNDLINPTHPATFLVGAGISMNPPSNLPSARQIVKELMVYCIPNDEIDAILNLTGLRYELFVELFAANIDNQLKFLAYFDQITQPNLIHLFLGWTIYQQHQYVITTNFDYLLEYALKAILNFQSLLDKTIIPVITRKDFENNPDPQNIFNEGKYPVYKLHGSKCNIITREDTTSSLISTISALGCDRSEGKIFTIEPYKRPAVQAIMYKRTLIVMGYSGSDDFDITPTLRECGKLERLIWISHQPSQEISIQKIIPNLEKASVSQQGESVNEAERSALRNVNQSDATDQLLLEISMDMPYEIYKIEGDTVAIIQKLWKEWFQNVPLSFDLSDPKKVQANPIPVTHLPLKEWIGKLYASVPRLTKYKLALDCFSLLENKKAVLRIAEHGLNVAQQEKQKASIAFFARKMGLIYLERADNLNAEKFFELALKTASNINEKYELAESLNAMGKFYSQHYSREKATPIYKKALKLFQKIAKRTYDPVFLSSYYQRMGILASYLNDDTKALRFYELALPLTAQTGDIIGRATLLHNLSMFYYSTKRFDVVIPYLIESIQISKLLNDFSGAFMDLDLLGMIHYDYKEWKQAILYYQEAFDIGCHLGKQDDAFMQFEQGKTHLLDYIAECYVQLGEWQTGLTYLQQALDLDQELGFPQSIAFDLKRIGEFYEKHNDRETALQYYQRALKIAETGNHLKIIDSIKETIGHLQ